MFNHRAFENSRSDGMSVMEILSTAGRSEQGRFVPLRRTELRGEVAGPLASLTLVQSYLYSSGQSEKVVELLYRFPLPGDAAVTAVRVRFGDVEIDTELKDRESAEASYDRAKREGRQAALLTRESPDVFTLRIAGIHPDQEVRVETSYLQLARAEGAGWSLRIPLTTAPRFVREDESGSRHAHGQPAALLRDPGHRFSLDLRFVETGQVDSPTHKLRSEAEGEGIRVTLKDGELLPDRDCLLNWRPSQEEMRPSLQILLHDDAASGQSYFLAMVAPPAVSSAPETLPREVILLVDHSGSMVGPKWEAADWAVKRFLLGLTDRDSFALGLFHDKCRWFAERLERADTSTVERALRFLDGNKDSGGTQLGLAVEQAIDMKRGSGEIARHLLVITDAEVSDEGRILRLVEEESARQERRRVSVLCIDAAPNSFLALQIAEQGGGVARFLTSAPEEEDITTALDELLADWNAPLLTELRLEVNRPRVEAAGRRSEETGSGWSSMDLGELPAGRAIWIAGRAPRAGGLPLLAFRVVTGNREIARWEVSTSSAIHTHPGPPALFGASRLLGLEFLIGSHRQGAELGRALAKLGYDAEELVRDLTRQDTRLYAENASSDARSALKKLLVEESLRYGIACSETAFVATRKEAGRKVEGTVIVANALPAGWSEDFLSPGSAALHQAISSYPSMPPQSPKSSFMQMLARPLSGPVMPFPAQSAGLGAADLRIGGSREVAMFTGVPVLSAGEATLFDSERDASVLGGEALTVSRLRLKLDGEAKPDGELAILIYVEDMVRPRARVKVAELLRQGGSRPLNLRRAPGDRIQIVLIDPEGRWEPARMELGIELG